MRPEKTPNICCLGRTHITLDVLFAYSNRAVSLLCEEQHWQANSMVGSGRIMRTDMTGSDITLKATDARRHGSDALIVDRLTAHAAGNNEPNGSRKRRNEPRKEPLCRNIRERASLQTMSKDSRK